MYINSKSKTALKSRFLIRKVMKPLSIGLGISVLIIGTSLVILLLSPIYIFKGVSKIVNKFFN